MDIEIHMFGSFTSWLDNIFGNTPKSPKSVTTVCTTLYYSLWVPFVEINHY